MGRLTNVGPRIPTLDPRRAQLQPANAPRRTGRWLVSRNDRIKVRDSYACCICGRITMELEVDHIVPLHLGGGDGDANLQSLCIPCHADKTRQEARNRAV